MRIKLFALGALVLMTFGGLTVSSKAGCGGPEVFGGDNPEADYEETLISGERSSITGIGFAGCKDITGGGCGSEEEPRWPENVELSLRGPVDRPDVPGGQRVVDLGEIDVESDGRFTHTFDVPELPIGLFDVLDESGKQVGSVRVVKRLP